MGTRQIFIIVKVCTVHGLVQAVDLGLQPSQAETLICGQTHKLMHYFHVGVIFTLVFLLLLFRIRFFLTTALLRQAILEVLSKQTP